tara:strand:+ start:590 stop:1306 length:717 start_codon:yes stop_codon:yes gene_type:complete
MTEIAKKIKRKRAPRKKNMYFTKVHENAIIEYAITDCNKIKTDLYVSLIQPAFSEMVDKIVYTYKFTNLPNIDYLKDDCKIWLTTILDKYDPNRKSKAFSYFSVITKNWFIHKVKKNSKSLKREICYEDFAQTSSHQENLVVENGYYEARHHYEFMQNLKKEISNWEQLNLKDNERKILNAIKILFDSVDDIEIFNKKAIYLYIREITGLNTKQVVNNLNKMRARYKDFKCKWDKGEI